ncbi:MAG: metallophosphoesterase [Labilithrix sp.]|nr:metallophosphoesterase [Labilithrix sp.]
MQNAQSLSTSVARIAHLSDVHMLAERPGPAEGVLDVSMRFVSFGRALDPRHRIRKLLLALRAARESGASHLVISGDLTELGTAAQFETLAEVLFDARVDPERVTLVPGNHDAYSRGDAWARALAGPLAPYRRSSAAADSSPVVVERDDAIFLPLDVACHQHFTRAAGELSAAAADALERTVRSVAGCGRPVVVVLHHSPFAHSTRAWQWLHGLRGHGRVLEMLARHPDLHVLHGHLHYDVEQAYGDGPARIFGAPATVDDEPGVPRVRLYDVEENGLRSVSDLPARRAA